jgi:hypothetical protein
LPPASARPSWRSSPGPAADADAGTGQDGAVKLERKHAVVLLLIAAWNVLSYANFGKNLAETAASDAERPTGYYVAHTVLIVVNLGVAAYLGRLGWRAWRGATDRAAVQ